jgi:hypothetical protein
LSFIDRAPIISVRQHCHSERGEVLANGGFLPRIGICCQRRNGFSDKISSRGYRGFPGLSSKMERRIYIPFSKSD